MPVSTSSVTSARLTVFKTLASGTSAELTLITSRTSSTDTLANADSGPKTTTGKKPDLTYFGKKNPNQKPCQKNSVENNSYAYVVPVLFYLYLNTGKNPPSGFYYVAVSGGQTAYPYCVVSRTELKDRWRQVEFGESINCNPGCGTHSLFG